MDAFLQHVRKPDVLLLNPIKYKEGLINIIMATPFPLRIALTNQFLLEWFKKIINSR